VNKTPGFSLLALTASLSVAMSLPFISGCSTAGKYACGSPNGQQPCSSLQENYRKSGSRAAPLPGTVMAPPVTEGAVKGRDLSTRPSVAAQAAPIQDPSLSEAGGVLPVSMVTSDGIPVRSDQKVLRVWVGPWEDESGVYHDQKYAYMVADEGRWVFKRNTPSKEIPIEAYGAYRPPVMGLPNQAHLPPALPQAAPLPDPVAPSGVPESAKAAQPAEPESRQAPKGAAEPGPSPSPRTLQTNLSGQKEVPAPNEPKPEPAATVPVPEHPVAIARPVVDDVPVAPVVTVIPEPAPEQVPVVAPESPAPVAEAPQPSAPGPAASKANPFTVVR